MVGQTKIQALLNNLTYKSFPNPLLLIGEDGCGKTLTSQIIASKLNIELKNISEALTSETIDDIYLCPIPTLYFINTSKFLSGNKVDKIEASLLKFLEEPPQNAKLVLSCTDINRLKDTIVNRCRIWTFAPYTIEELKNFTSDETILQVAHTPGQVLSYIEQSPDKMKELAEKIIKKIHLASPSNVFAICNQLSFEEPIQKETFNIDLFVPVLEYVAAQLYITEESDNYYNIYSRILKLKDRLKVPYAKKEHLFSQFLMELKLDELVVKS